MPSNGSGITSGASNQKADLYTQVGVHLEQIVEDVQKLQDLISTATKAKLALERENEELRGNAVNVSKPSLLSVAFRKDHPPQNLEDEFAEAFRDRSPQPSPAVSSVLSPSTQDKLRQSKMLSRSDSGMSMSKCTWERFLAFLVHSGPPAVIVLNSLAMGMAIDYSPEHPAWGVLELTFALCYLAEFIYKVRVFGLRGYFWGPEYRWNWFDFFCLILSFVDVLLFFLLLAEVVNFSMGSASMIKVARLARLLRLVRTLHYEFFNELRLIILGVFSGLRVLFWAIVLLLVIIYVFGIGMATLAEDQAEFSSLPASMFTIFRCFTEGCAAYDGTPLPERLRRTTFEDSGGAFMIGYILVFMLVSVGVFNLIMAIFLDNVVSQQTLRKQKELSETALKADVNIKRVVADILWQEEALDLVPADFERLGLAHQSKVLGKALSKVEVTVTRDRFQKWLDHESFTDVLEASSVDTSIRAQLFDILDADSGGLLSIDELISGLMSLRGDVTKGDIIAMSLKVRYLLETLNPDAPRRVSVIK